jgi:hypothetical protein
VLLAALLVPLRAACSDAIGDREDRKEGDLGELKTLCFMTDLPLNFPAQEPVSMPCGGQLELGLCHLPSRVLATVF